MQTKKAKYHLKRIETILNLHEDKLSPMDRDILLDDIRQLYDLILFGNDASVNGQSPSVPAQEPSTRVSQPETEPKPLATPAESNNQPNPTPAEPFVDSKIQENEYSHRAPGNSASGRPENTPTDETTHTPTTVTYEESPAQTAESPIGTGPAQPRPETSHPTNASHENGTTSQVDEHDEEVLVEKETEYPELFDFTYSADLSDRLANSKIENLNRILTINDKILFINHLFGGEAIPFQDSIKKFENFYTYDEAKSYASRDLVEMYDWTHPEKADTVRQFMRQVKRLYN